MDEQKNKEVIIIIVSVIVIILVAYLGISPAVASLKTSNYTVASKGDDLKKAQENLDNLKNLQSAIESNSNEIKALTSSFPDSVDAEDMVTSLEAIASRNGMQMTSITPLDTASTETASSEEAAPTTETGVGEANFDIVIRGSYQGLQKFMTDLESSRRPMSVSKLSISKETGSEGTSTLNSTITVTAYYSQTTQSQTPQE